MYSKDFKLAVVAHANEGNTQEATAKKFKVGTSSVEKWTKEKRETGDIRGEFSLANRKPRKINDVRLREIVKHNPDLLPKDIAEQFGCTDEAIRLAMKRCNITRKKK